MEERVLPESFEPEFEDGRMILIRQMLTDVFHRFSDLESRILEEGQPLDEVRDLKEVLPMCRELPATSMLPLLR